LKNLRFGDLYRNVSRYLKKNECKHDFTGTRLWLEKWNTDPKRIDAMITKIKSCGANCDCEIISKVKPKINGRNLFLVIED